MLLDTNPKELKKSKESKRFCRLMITAAALKIPREVDRPTSA